VRRIPIVLAVWTLFVWGVRIKNADGSVGAVVPALTFIVPAAAVLATKGARLPTLVLAAWTVVVWIVRLVDIVVLSDHSAAFTIVHALLGIISIALARAAARSVAAPGRVPVYS
jgi:hypothetical protein